MAARRAREVKKSVPAAAAPENGGAEQEPPATVTLGLDEAIALCEQAAVAAGASEATAGSLARSVVDAEAEGLSAVGLSHFVDYLDALRSGRLNGRAEPQVTQPAICLYLSDAGGGAAHTAFDRKVDDLARTARLFGVAIFAQRNGYTCGSLGYFTRRLAEKGLVALAAANGPALLAGPGLGRPIYCTNPLSLAAPAASGPPLVIDQSCSEAAFVSIRRAAEEGRKLPVGWALDKNGKPTTDPSAAIKGALAAFGGWRGANIALMVEVLSAGVSGANWSLDAPPFDAGDQSPGAGLTVLAIQPRFFAPDFAERLEAQLDRLAGDYGVHVPGRARAAAASRARQDGLTVPLAVVEHIAGSSPRP